ncbi:hypothetical protein Misp02_22900 [Microtetraspora sp. NBRC 16547]|nr:hypothetical protein Misp02_22900 [Microtetraspora sp. NBRC 16547]
MLVRRYVGVEARGSPPQALMNPRAMEELTTRCGLNGTLVVLPDLRMLGGRHPTKLRFTADCQTHLALCDETTVRGSRRGKHRWVLRKP